MEKQERQVISAVLSGPDAYERKANQYFAGARKDLVNRLPDNRQARILEVGCGNGDTGAYALTSGKCGVYCGVDICAKAVADARLRLSEVFVGDIEKIELPYASQTFDALIMSEVLEHLVDPWSTLRRLKPLLRPGAITLASSPNVAQYHTILMLLRGEWMLEDKGLMDATHLRWFTPKSYRRMFEECGFRVEAVWPKASFRPKQRLALALMLGRGKHLFAGQICVCARNPDGVNRE